MATVWRVSQGVRDTCCIQILHLSGDEIYLEINLSELLTQWQLNAEEIHQHGAICLYVVQILCSLNGFCPINGAKWSFHIICECEWVFLCVFVFDTDLNIACLIIQVFTFFFCSWDYRSEEWNVFVSQLVYVLVFECQCGTVDSIQVYWMIDWHILKYMRCK